MGLPANYSDGGKMKRLAAGIEELDREAAALNAEWETRSGRAGRLKPRDAHIFPCECGHFAVAGLYSCSINPESGVKE